MNQNDSQESSRVHDKTLIEQAGADVSQSTLLVKSKSHKDQIKDLMKYKYKAGSAAKNGTSQDIDIFPVKHREFEMEPVDTDRDDSTPQPSTAQGAAPFRKQVTMGQDTWDLQEEAKKMSMLQYPKGRRGSRPPKASANNLDSVTVVSQPRETTTPAPSSGPHINMKGMNRVIPGSANKTEGEETMPNDQAFMDHYAQTRYNSRADKVFNDDNSQDEGEEDKPEVSFSEEGSSKRDKIRELKTKLDSMKQEMDNTLQMMEVEKQKQALGANSDTDVKPNP